MLCILYCRLTSSAPSLRPPYSLEGNQVTEESAQALLDVLDGRAAPLNLKLEDNDLPATVVQRAAAIHTRKSLEQATAT